MREKVRVPEMVEVSSKDIDEVLVLVNNYYNFDMRGYSKASLRRRFIRLMELENLDSVFELKHALINQQISYTELLNELTVNVTEMFRDPSFFKLLRTHVIPYLKTFPYFRIWHAGCSSGEEMYSLAILLKEEGILDRSLQYGTDINSEVLETAKSGIYDLRNIKQYSVNYQRSGGKQSLSDYYSARYGKLKMNQDLSKNMTFAIHNLAHDSSFNQFQLIICRNVLIYFDFDLQKRVYQLFGDSISHNGYLALGTQESLIKDSGLNSMKTVVQGEKLFHNQLI